MPLPSSQQSGVGTALHLAMRAALNAQSLQDIEVVYGRAWPMPQSSMAQVRVMLEDSQVAQLGTLQAPVDWTTRLRVVCLARSVVAPAVPPAALSALADVACDQLATLAYQTFFAALATGGALAALAGDGRCLGLAYSQDEADTLLVSAELLFELRHRTAFDRISA